MAEDGDIYVFNVQQWLNNNYEQYVASGRYNLVTENGKIGWNTIFGLIRAFQIELGILTTADNFGSGTCNAFNSKYARSGEKSAIIQQEDKDLTENNVYGLIQCALLCKGYPTGNNIPTLHFYNKTGNAVKKFKSDAGLTDTSSDVTLNVIKALLSMDYFKSYDSSIRTQKIIEMQRYLNGTYEDYIGIKPCDGIYGRETSTSIIYAIQAEEGMAVSMANGNCGPSTKRCLPTIPYSGSYQNNGQTYGTKYNGSLYTDVEINKVTRLFNIALYCNGFGDGTINDTINSNIIRNFQSKYGLQVTGNVDYSTWLANLISCGDINRSSLACDCSTILTVEKASTLYNAGFRYVGRYLSGTVVGGVSKALTKEEIQTMYNAGLRFFPIQQGNATTVTYFTENQAILDANNAYLYATNLEIPMGAIIYFAVDCDPQDYQITSNIIPYFKKVYETMRDLHGSNYIIGIYGTRNVCNRVYKSGYAMSSFVSDISTGFSGNLGFIIPNNWAFDQFNTVTIGSGNNQIEIDKDSYSGYDKGIGRNGLSELNTVYANLLKIYNLALSYSNNNITKSNQLTLEYLRYLKGGNYGALDEYGKKWEIMAGAIDSTFCNIVNSALGGDINLNFHDPIKTQLLYDILHFAATLNAILYPVISNNLSGLDSLVDPFAGWAGDVIKYGTDVKNNGNSQEWANNNICLDSNLSQFGLEDYLADIDAIAISLALKSNAFLSVPEAFIIYFSHIDIDTGKIAPAMRTNIFISSFGSYSQFLNTGLTYMTSDTFPFPFLRNMITDSGVEQEHISKAFNAFSLFVSNQLIAEDS